MFNLYRIVIFEGPQICANINITGSLGDLDDAAPQLDALKRCRRSRADLSIFIYRLFLTNKLLRPCLSLFADAVDRLLLPRNFLWFCGSCDSVADVVKFVSATASANFPKFNFLDLSDAIERLLPPAQSLGVFQYLKTNL